MIQQSAFQAPRLARDWPVSFDAACGEARLLFVIEMACEVEHLVESSTFPIVVIPVLLVASIPTACRWTESSSYAEFSRDSD
jgi:hypothetical protein